MSVFDNNPVHCRVGFHRLGAMPKMIVLTCVALIGLALLIGFVGSSMAFDTNVPVEFQSTLPLSQPSSNQVVVTNGLTVKKMPEARMLASGELFNLEVALTQEDLLRGLMYRSHLPPKTGMLFPFVPAQKVNFWMKNTLVPLDMVFIRNRLVVHVVHNVPPCVHDPCPSVNSLYPVDMVVELPAGTAEQFALDMGTPVTFLSRDDVQQMESLQTHLDTVQQQGSSTQNAPVRIMIPKKSTDTESPSSMPH